MTIERRKDWSWISVVSVLILLWSSIPTWAGYHAETPELRFRGLYYDSQDYAVHIAMMEAGNRGDWTYQLRFTTEPHRPAYIRLFYVVLGHVSGWFGIPCESMFQVARWIFGWMALVALYQIMRQVFPEIYWARVGFLIATLGSGLGWFQLLFGWAPDTITPIDFWLTDDYVFFSLSVFPHFAFVTAAMCWVLLLWLRFLEEPRWIKILGIVLIVASVQLVNPIAFAAVDASLFGAALFSWWSVKKFQIEDVVALLTIAFAQVPLLAYNFLLLNRDPLWSDFTAQNQTLSPPPSYYFWGFALFWPLAILGVISIFRTRSKVLGACLFWIGSAFILAYGPFYIQRRFLQNITIPLGVVATFGLKFLVENALKKLASTVPLKSIIVVACLFLMSMSSVQLSLGRASYLQTHPEQFYYPASLDAAIRWLRQNAQYNDFVLASESTAQVLAQKAGIRVYLGHEMETLHYSNKQANVQAFFAGRLPDLAKAPIKWVVYGPAEKLINPNFMPPDTLELVYETPALRIYQLR
jgi:hypothetical protein